MVEERITDGRRIAELLASELDGRADGGLERIAVTNAAQDVECDGARAYDVECDGALLARAFVHEEGVRLAFERGLDPALETAHNAGLKTDAGDDDLVVRVATGAAVKRATAVIQSASRGLES